MRNHHQGFTLIELMVATAIAGILAATAYPSFMAPIHKSRRIDAITALLDIQMGQERWRSGHSTYAELTELRSSAVSSQRFYALTVSDVGASSFTAIASATGAQANDQACRQLRLVVADGDSHYASGPDDATTNTSADNKRCWNL